MSSDLVVQQQTNPAGLTIATDDGLNHAYRVAKAMAQSGLFKDTTSANQAFAKIVAGIEYGVGAFAAMSQIHVIDGKLSPGATLIAALIRKSGRYRFRQLESTVTVCRLEFYSRDDDGSWMSEGEVGFTMQEAVDAGLTGKPNWKKHPADMLFARALSRGARRFCADVFGGQSTYTPDELGGTHHEPRELILDDAAADVDAVGDANPDDVDEVVVEAEPVAEDDPLGGGDAPRVSFLAAGSKGDSYTVTVHHDGSWSCTCPARSDDCRHVIGLRRPFPGGGWLWPGDPGYETAGRPTLADRAAGQAARLAAAEETGEALA